jgi:surface protein
MVFMFKDAKYFDQDISTWNTSNVTNMAWMFYRTSRFNSDISNWDVSKVTNMSNMLLSSNLSTANLTLIYEKWSEQTLQQNVTFHAGNTKYSASAQAGRDILENTYNWDITDGGQV